MKAKRYNSPHLQAGRGEELHLSGQAILELMRAVLSRGFSFRFKALGSSMTPFIRDGDLITIAPMANKSPRLGDVVAFSSSKDGKLIVHRIVAEVKGSFVIQGDGVGPQGSVFVSDRDIMGCVQKIERNRHSVWFGLGPERAVIAWLSRKDSLIPLYQRLASWKRKLLNRASYS